MRKPIFIAACLVLAYSAVELVSFLVLASLDKTRPKTFVARMDEAFKGIDEADLAAYFGGPYDSVLGWDNKPGTTSTEKNCLGEPWTESFGPDGARETPHDFGSTLIASYGDSYLKGGEVDNGQTWQYQLAESLGSNVKNYAVGAYGPYQAVLKLRRHVGQGIVYPVTLLGIHEQNVKRVVNLYRPFLYSRTSDRFAFKPGLSCVGDKCERVGNLLQPDSGMAEMRLVLAEAHRRDHWIRHRPAFEFPWSLNAFKLAGLAIEKLTETVHEPLWHAPEGIAAMDEVIAEFRDLAKNAASVPVVLFIPNSAKSGSRPSYGDYKQRIAVRYPDLVVLDISEAQFDVKRFRLKPASCHPSEYGHSVIARLVGEGLSGVLAGNEQEWRVGSVTPEP